MAAFLIVDLIKKKKHRSFSTYLKVFNRFLPRKTNKPTFLRTHISSVTTILLLFF